MSHLRTGGRIPRDTPAPGPGARPGPSRRALLLRGLALLLSFPAAGVLLGLLWVDVVWSPGEGQVSSGAWYPLDERALSMQTDGTSSYVLVAAIGGLVLGLLVALLSTRAELVGLAVVVVGGALAAYVMWAVGTGMGPADPMSLAKDAQDGTRLPSALTVQGASPFLVLPVVALGVLAITFFLSPEAGRAKSGVAADQAG